MAAILKEQSLSVLSSAASTADRLKVGQLLHADLLVILTRRDAQTNIVELVVSETKHGLRLRATQLPITADPEADAVTLAAEVSTALRAKALELLALVRRQPLAPPDLKREAQELAARGRRFFSIGNYQEAAALAEASLLLQPDQADVHRMAMSAYGHCTWSSRDKLAQIAFSEQAVVHMERFLLLTDISSYHDSLGMNLANDLAVSLDCIWWPLHTPEEEAADAVYQAHTRDALRRVILAKHQEETLDDSALRLLLGRWLSLVNRTTPTFADRLAQRMQMVPCVIAPTVQVPYYQLELLLCSGIDEYFIKDPAYIALLDTLEKQYTHKDVLAIVAMQRATLRRLNDPYRQGFENANTPPATTPPKPTAPPEAPQVILTPLTWTSNNVPLRRGQFYFLGLIPCEGIDLVWGYRSSEGACIYLMRGKADLQPILAEKEVDARTSGTGVFDGRYAWIAIAGKTPKLVAVEVATGTVTTITAADGFPPAQYTALGGLAPGKLCLGGAFGPQTARRAFIALVTLEPGKPPNVRVIHEATRQLDRTQDLGPQYLDPQLNFLPSFILVAKNAAGKPQAIIARSLPDFVGSNPSLLVDPETGKVTVIVPGAESDIRNSYVPIVDQAAYWIARDGIHRLALDSTGNDPICPAPEKGRLIFYQGHVYDFGTACSVADGLDKPFRKLNGDPAFNKINTGMITVFASAQLGIVLDTMKNNEWCQYTVSFPEGNKP